MTLVLVGVLEKGEKNLIVVEDLKNLLTSFSELKDLPKYDALRLELWNEGRQSDMSPNIALRSSDNSDFASALKAVRKYALEFLQLDDDEEYNSYEMENYYSLENGIYSLKSLSGIATATLIKDIIVNSTHPYYKFKITGSGGYADVIGMYANQRFGINLEFERIPGTRDMVVFFKRP